MACRAYHKISLLIRLLNLSLLWKPDAFASVPTFVFAYECGSVFLIHMLRCMQASKHHVDWKTFITKNRPKCISLYIWDGNKLLLIIVVPLKLTYPCELCPLFSGYHHIHRLDNGSESRWRLKLICSRASLGSPFSESSFTVIPPSTALCKIP